jgi:hypothetical protein
MRKRVLLGQCFLRSSARAGLTIDRQICETGRRIRSPIRGRTHPPSSSKSTPKPCLQTCTESVHRVAGLDLWRRRKAHAPNKHTCQNHCLPSLGNVLHQLVQWSRLPILHHQCSPNPDLPTLLGSFLEPQKRGNQRQLKFSQLGQSSWSRSQTTSSIRQLLRRRGQGYDDSAKWFEHSYTNYSLSRVMDQPPATLLKSLRVGMSPIGFRHIAPVGVDVFAS